MKTLCRITLAVCLALPTSGRAAAAPDPAQITAANITRVTTNLLGHSQFAHHPLDTELAGRLLDRYLDALDGSRSLFLQSDVDELSKARATLARATLEGGDTSVARAMFARYLQRLGQQVVYVGEHLRTDKLTFTDHDVYSFDREHARRPADLAAAHVLWQQQLRAEYLQEKLTDKKPEQIVKLLTRRHEQQLVMMKGLHDDEVLETYLDALAHVYDPHSDYLGHEQMESFSIAMNLALFGIGAALESEDGACKIRDLLPGGPAARSGLLKVGDRIVAVAQAGKEPVDITNMPLSRSVELIRGPKGTKVTLTIAPAGVAESALPKVITLTRDEIKLADQEAKARIIELPAPAGAPVRVGVVELPSFYANMGKDAAGGPRSATRDVARLLSKLQAEKVRGIVVDLRRNGGGSLEEAITLTGLFLRKGPVVQTRESNGKIEVGADTDGKLAYDGPLVLLTSRFSASATEIMVGALQDYGRGVVVGDSSTFGKGTVQTLVSLAPLMDRAGLQHAYDPGALKVTISKFYRPSGASTQLRGVASDIVLPSTTDFADVSEAALKDPLPWDVVPAAPFEPQDRVRPYLAKLRESSARRVKTDKAFVRLAGEIERLGRSIAAKSVSLDEAQRRTELAEAKARKADAERERRALAAHAPLTYELTLANVDAPGLPAPVDPTKKLPGAKDAGADDAMAPTGSPADILFDESLRILTDYIALLRP